MGSSGTDPFGNPLPGQTTAPGGAWISPRPQQDPLGIPPVPNDEER